jgi:hypothetical protein
VNVITKVDDSDMGNLAVANKTVYFMPTCDDASFDEYNVSSETRGNWLECGISYNICVVV